MLVESLHLMKLDAPHFPLGGQAKRGGTGVRGCRLCTVARSLLELGSGQKLDTLGPAVLVTLLLGPAWYLLAPILDQKLGQEPGTRVNPGISRGVSHGEEPTNGPISPAGGTQAQI